MKKLNKFFAVLVALAMMAVLSVTAFAAEGDKQNNNGLAIEKVLTMPKGLAPTGSITINATLNTIDGVAPASSDTSGVISPVTIDLATTDATNTAFVEKVTDGATDTYYYGTPNLLPTYTHGGQYIYTISEDAADWEEAVEADTTKQATTDSTTYQLTVNVNKDGVVQSLYVGTGADKKPLYTEITTENDEIVAENGTAFKNSVTQEKTADTYETSQFKASKTVNADAQGVKDTTREFEFTATVILPNITGEETATYTVLKADGSTKDTGTITHATENGTVKVKLADGEKVFFNKVPVGSIVSISETDATVGAEDAKQYTQNNAKVDAETIAIDSAYEAAVVNTRKETSATGILMSNLPYIVLALVAIGGMVAYVVVRRRNADEA